MPSAMECALGVVGPEAVTKTLLAMFPKLKAEDIDLEDFEFTREVFWDFAGDINGNIQGIAFPKMVERAGFTITKKEKSYLHVNTPLGPRKLGKPNFTIYYDPHETMQTLDDIVLGVRLSSRYVPTYLDWRCEHGSPGTFALRAMEPMLSIAREEIKPFVPWIDDADVCVIDCFY